MRQDLSSAHILLVEDELHLALGIERNLRAEGYEVTRVADGQGAVESMLGKSTAGPESADHDRTRRAVRPRFDLVVLDVMLPKKDGFAVCKEVRGHGFAVPILFLSARASPSERVEGLQLGADDYLGKPFYLAEFLGRVQALLRRSLRDKTVESKDSGFAWPPRQAQVDLARAEIRFADGHAEEVGAREAAVLRALWRSQGEVVSREDLLEAAWGQEVMPSSRVLEGIVARWRQHLEPMPEQPVWLTTIAGVGYRLRRP